MGGQHRRILSLRVTWAEQQDLISDFKKDAEENFDSTDDASLKLFLILHFKDVATKIILKHVQS